VTHPVWPLFDLRVVTPRLELRYIDDELACALALLAQQGIHAPDFMPFLIEWTDVAPEELTVQTMQFYWRCRADLTPQSWSINFAVIVDGAVVGSTGLGAKSFPVLREFETGSWLGRAHQGKGYGKEFRRACLHLGFAGLGAAMATTGAYLDNGPSLGVTRSLGYTEAGRRRAVRRGCADELIGFRMPREHWEQNVRRDDIEIHGLEPCLRLLGAT
jgi:RimJ/RimL family protein N-acetyltransferase